MKTDELINALVADTASVKPPISRTVWAGVAAGLLLASAVFFAAFNVRADFTYAITHHPRYIFKFVFILALAVPALLLVRRLARPDGKAGKLVWALGIGPLLLLVAVLIEMAAVPAAHWGVSALGNMPGACMKYIPLLSLPPLVAALYVLRQGAPSNPLAAGAAAGLLSAGIAATLYASFCADDSPMFLAIWYVGAIAIVVAFGALIGARCLRW